MEDFFIKLISAEKDYGGAKALEDINLGLHRGRTVGVLGGKRSGKTALCRLLGGIEKPSEGKVLFDGKKIKPSSKRRISFMQSDNFIGRMGTFQRLFEFYETFYYDFDRKKAAALMKNFGVDDVERITKNKGLCQLAALACCVSRKADMYVLDDPLTYFDRDERGRFLKEAFRSLGNKPLIVIAAEKVRGIESLLDDVIFLDGGRMKLCKSAEEIRIKTDKSVEALYGEVFENADL